MLSSSNYIKQSTMSSFILISICLFITTGQAQYVTVLFESKLDGKVLTVTDQLVPPTGPYERLGVAALLRNDSIAQSWTISTQDETSVYPVNAPYGNSLTVGLPCDNCFSYNYYYNFVNTANGLRLLKRLDLIDDNELCVKNPGNEAFITAVECDESDDSQLWTFIPQDETSAELLIEKSASSEERGSGEEETEALLFF